MTIIFNNKELEKKIEEIWEEIKEKYLEKGIKEKELEIYKSELISKYITDVVDNKKEKEEILETQLEDLSDKQKDFILAEGGRYFERCKQNLVIAKTQVAKKVGDKAVKDFCEKRICLVQLGNFEFEKKAISKLVAIKLVLDSYREEIKEIERLKMKINELEEEYHQKNEEEKIQKEIDILKLKVSFKKTKNDDKLTNEQLEELEKSIDSLQNNLKVVKKNWIIKKIENFLIVKKTYLDIRQEIAEELQKCCDNNTINNVKYSKRKIIIKGIGDLLGSITIPVKVFNINPGKLVEVVSDINDYHKIIFDVKCSEEFANCLENSGSDKTLFEKTYDSLVKVIEENREISDEIINDLKLEDKESSAKVLWTFESRYKEICSIAENWKKDYSDLNEMRAKVKSIVGILSILNSELSVEENRIKGIKNKLHEVKERSCQQKKLNESDKMEKVACLENSQDWTSIHPGFQDSTIKDIWSSYFTYEQAIDWFYKIKGLNPQEGWQFILWLRNKNWLTSECFSENFLNRDDLAQLQADYQNELVAQQQNSRQ